MPPFFSAVTAITTDTDGSDRYGRPEQHIQRLGRDDGSGRCSCRRKYMDSRLSSIYRHILRCHPYHCPITRCRQTGSDSRLYRPQHIHCRLLCGSDLILWILRHISPVGLDGSGTTSTLRRRRFFRSVGFRRPTMVPYGNTAQCI